MFYWEDYISSSQWLWEMHAIRGHHNFTGEEIEVKSTAHGHVAQQLQGQHPNSGRQLPEDKLLTTPLMTTARWFRTQAISSPLCHTAARISQAEGQHKNVSAQQRMCLSELGASAEVVKLNCHVPSHTQLQDSSHPSGAAAWGSGWAASCNTNLDGSSHPNPHCTTIQGGYRLCWETNDVKHLLENMSTGCNKPSLQTSTCTDTPITLLVGALASQLSCFNFFFFYESTWEIFCTHHLGKVSGMQREGRTKQ